MKDSNRIKFPTNVPLNLILVMGVMVVLFFGTAILFTSWSATVADSNSLIGPRGPKGDKGDTGNCNLTDPDQIFTANSLSVNVLNVSTILSNSNDTCIIFEQCAYMYSTLLLGDGLLFGSSLGFVPYVDSLDNVTKLTFIGDVTFNGSTEFNFTIPFPLIFPPGGLKESNETGFELYSNSSLRLTAPDGIYGEMRFKDKLIVENNLTFSPCNASLTCRGGALEIKGPSVKIIGNDLDLTETSVTNVTFQAGSGVLFNSTGYILPGTGQCKLKFSPDSCLDGKLFLQTLADLVFLSTNGTLDLSNARLIVGNLTILSNFNISGFLQFANMQISNNLIVDNLLSVLNIIASFVQANSISVSGGSFSVTNGVATFTSSTTTSFAGNVAFIPGPNKSVTCQNPFTSDSFSTPTTGACIPECLDFYRCETIRSIGITARNALSVAENTVNVPLDNATVARVGIGVELDYLSTNYSYVNEVQISAEDVRVKSSNRMEFISREVTQFKSFNRTSIIGITKYDTTLSPPGCTSFLFYSNGTVSFNIPGIYNSSSTCTQVLDRFYYSNTTQRDSHTFIGSAVVRRTCVNYCTPFFEFFTKDFAFEELFFNYPTSYNRTNVTFSQDEANIVFDYIVNYILERVTDFPETNATLDFLDQNYTTSQDSFTLESYAFVNASGSDGLLTLDASHKIELGQGNLIIDRVADTFNVKGDILDETGNIHPCCSGVQSVSQNIKTINYDAFSFSGISGDSGELTLNWLGTATATGILNRVYFNTINSSFISNTSTPVLFEANMFMDFNSSQFSSGNITNLGCVYKKRSSSGTLLQTYQSNYVSVYSILQTTAGLYTLHCRSAPTYLTSSGQSLQINIATKSPTTNTYTENYGLSIVSGMVQMNTL